MLDRGTCFNLESSDGTVELPIQLEVEKNMWPKDVEGLSSSEIGQQVITGCFKWVWLLACTAYAGYVCYYA